MGDGESVGIAPLETRETNPANEYSDSYLGMNYKDFVNPIRIESDPKNSHLDIFERLKRVVSFILRVRVGQ